MKKMKEAWPGAGFDLDLSKAKPKDFRIIEEQLEKQPDTQSKIDFLVRVDIEINHLLNKAKLAENFIRVLPLIESGIQKRCLLELKKLEAIRKVESRQKAKLAGVAPAELNETPESATAQIDFEALLRAVEGGDIAVQDAISVWKNIKDKSMSRREQGEKMYQALTVAEKKLTTAGEKRSLWASARLSYADAFEPNSLKDCSAGTFPGQIRTRLKLWEEAAKEEEREQSPAITIAETEEEGDQKGQAKDNSGRLQAWGIYYLLKFAKLNFDEVAQCDIHKLMTLLTGKTESAMKDAYNKVRLNPSTITDIKAVRARTGHLKVLRGIFERLSMNDVVQAIDDDLNAIKKKM